MDNNNTTIHFLPFHKCLLVDLLDNEDNCSTEFDCWECPVIGGFQTGEDIDDFESAGHIIIILLWISTLVFFPFGILSNFMFLYIKKKSIDCSKFNIFRTGLAILDMIGSGSAFVSSSLAVMIYMDWNRELPTQYIFHITTLVCFLARSGSLHMTVLMTFVQFLKSRNSPLANWFTGTKLTSKLVTLYVYSFTILMGLPLFFSYFSLSTTTTPVARIFAILTFYVPVPMLLFLNILVLVKMHAYFKSKIQDKMEQTTVRTDKLLTFVVIFFLTCNIFPSLLYYYVIKDGFVYRELFSTALFSVSVNSAVNPHIYYFAKDGRFADEVKALFANNLGDSVCARKLRERIERNQSRNDLSQSQFYLYSEEDISNRYSTLFAAAYRVELKTRSNELLV